MVLLLLVGAHCVGLRARLAQSAERKALNRVVVGSSPTVGVFAGRVSNIVVDGGWSKMDTLEIEPRAFRMRSGCDTTTPCAHDIPAQISPYFSEHRWSSGRIHRSQPSPPLPLRFSCVCCRGCPSSSASSCSAVRCSVSSWLGGGLGAMSRRREIHGAATITARKPATLRAQALPGRLELPILRLTASRSSQLS